MKTAEPPFPPLLFSYNLGQRTFTNLRTTPGLQLFRQFLVSFERPSIDSPPSTKVLTAALEDSG